MGKLSALPPNSTPTVADLFVMIQAAGPTDVKVSLQNIINILAANSYQPYKFSVYRNAALTPVSAVIGFDTKLFDTGSNVDIVTNKGRFTAPIAGFYFFTTTMAFATTGTNTGVDIDLYKNGALVKNGARSVAMYAGNYTHTYTAGGLLQLAANDYIEVVQAAGSNFAIVPGSASAFFDGWLVSQT